MALAINASTPNRTVGTTGSITTIVSASFTPPSNSLLLCMYADGNGAIGCSGMAGGSLTYTKRASEIASASAEIWSAPVATSPGAMTVTATLASAEAAGLAVLLGVIVLTGAQNASPVGATNVATSASGAPSCAVTTTAANSWCFGMVSNFTNATLPTIPSGQTDVFNTFTCAHSESTTGTATWAQATTAATAGSGTLVTINDTAPTCDYSACVVEVLVAGAAVTDVQHLKRHSPGSRPTAQAGGQF